ncbi:MAG TPA: DUF3943 domain-containing protein [Flavobacterium sp.]|uniref:DUF3943 domain-containing protein n=1 Tax=Flavobacterium sp. TaxID=239 RepID=UPI002DBD6CEF|nr:DUF3943 domain-containing protein [Flavobacterium sp.]HEU4791397.1 DUF3943 domain-containing protein [Flavobacterium sp.]
MNLLKPVLYAFIILLSGNTIFAQQEEQSINNQNQLPSSLPQNTIVASISQKESTESITPYNYNMLSLTDSTLVQQNGIAYPPTKRDYTRLGYDTAMYVGATIIAFGVLYAMPESVTNWDKEAMKENGITYKWKQNVKAGPVWDEDDWVLNWITHPYSGGVYYMTARSSGFNMLESFLYSAFMSTCFWEYGIEAFAEIPSKQDLIITPVVGSVVGEGFFYAKKSILRHDKKVLNSKALGYTTLFLIDPFNTLLDSFGYKEKTKTQLSLAPIGFDKGVNKAIWGLNFNMQF